MNFLKFSYFTMASLYVVGAMAANAYLESISVRIEPSDFSSVSSESFLAQLSFKAADGQIEPFQTLPENIKKVLALYETKTIPNVEFRDAPARDVLNFLSDVEPTSRPVRLGLSLPQKPVYREWNLALDETNTTISCSLTQVTLLEFSVQVAKSLSLEIGLLEDGKIVFGKNGQWTSDVSPLFTIVETPRLGL